MKTVLLFAMTTMLGATLTFAQTASTPAPSNANNKAASTTKTKKHHKAANKQAGKSTPASASTTSKSK